MLLAPAAHLYVALAVRTDASGGRVLHTQLGQEPHHLEQEETVCPLQNRQVTRASSDMSKVSILLQLLPAQVGSEEW